MSVRRLTGLTQLKSGRWRVRKCVSGVTLSLGTYDTKEEAVSVWEAGVKPTTPAPELACCTPAGTTERQEGSLEDHLSPASISILHELMAAAPTLHSLNRAADRALALFKKYLLDQQTNPDWVAYRKTIKG